jgi:hypothetical protein
MRDYQRKAVYAWERKAVAPFGGPPISFENAQMAVDGIWLAMGLKFPPKVKRKEQHNVRVWAKANREQVWLPPEGVPTWVIIHELAHSMTFNVDGCEDSHHGPDFVGIYIKMLDKFLGIPTLMSMYTAKQAGLDFNLAATPVFVK